MDIFRDNLLPWCASTRYQLFVLFEQQLVTIIYNAKR